MRLRLILNYVTLSCRNEVTQSLSESPVCCFTKVTTIADRFMLFRGSFAAKSSIIKLLPVESSNIDT